MAEIARRRAAWPARYSFTLDGRTLTIGQWARETGIGYPTLYNRLIIQGLDIQTALATQGRTDKGRAHPGQARNHVTYQGVTRSVKEWALLLGLSYECLYYRLYVKGWSVEKAITTPFMGRIR